MGKIKRFFTEFRFKGVLAIAFVFCLMAVILFIELTGVQFNYIDHVLTLLPAEQIVTKENACLNLDVDTLLLWDSSNSYSSNSLEQFTVILEDMKVGYDITDLSVSDLPNLRNYDICIVLLADLTPLNQQVTDLCQWVYEGGNAMFPLSLEQNAYSASLENKLGIQSSSDFTYVDDIYVYDNFMIGGDRTYAIPDAYDSARTVRLFTDCTTVYAAEGSKDGVPLIWTSSYGEGTFLVDNFGMCDKAYRGFYAASLSLLTDVFLYPVINGSTFYLDDFPSQIPDGKNEYISRDYNTTVRDFYLNIWWPDMMNLCDKYGLKYTGLAIECYDNAIDGTTSAKPDKATFTQLGNMLLRKGGEIGYHGYNHQPLALNNKDYRDIYDYLTWINYDAMKTAFQELVDFCDELFPTVNMSVYVPPSNLLSDEGRQMLIKEFPHIRTLSGIYLPDDVLDFALLQEYEVDQTGLVDQPRIISGCDIDDYMTLGAFSELNFHFVNNHFTHPDDALDPDRGAILGWKELYRRFDSYLNWLYTSAPSLRNTTGSELSAAVQRFAAVTPKKTQTGNTITVEIENFYDDAQFLIRFNTQEPQNVRGGKLSHLTGDLYLLEAHASQITITLKEEP